MNSAETPKEEAMDTENPAADTQAATQPDTARAEFENLEADQKSPPKAPPQQAAHNDVNLDVILDVSVTLSMELGRARVPIRNLLQLNQGSVVELERAAGEPLDVYVNGTLIAHGEVVVVNERFGVRLTDVASPAERIRNLK